MNVNHYIGFDVHKKTINYCVKMADGQIVEEGRLRATHDVLRQWAGRRREPWRLDQASRPSSPDAGDSRGLILMGSCTDKLASEAMRLHTLQKFHGQEDIVEAQ